MRRLLLAFLLATSPAFAQTLTMWPASTVSSPVQPRQGAYPTITAIINGQNDQRVNWTTTCGTLSYNSAPPMTGPQTAGLYSATAQTCTVTATSRVGGLTGTAVIKFVGTASVTTGHPRFLTTSSGLAALQAKGTAGNALYANGISSLASLTTSEFAPYFTWSTWSGSACTGGSGPSADVSGMSGPVIEQGAMWESEVSLFDSSATNRNTAGCHGRDLYIATINYVLNGTLNFEAGGGRWADGLSIYAWEITADNLMAGGYLSSSDLALVRTFMHYVNQFSASNTYGNGISPAPSNTSPNYNSTALFTASGAGTGASQQQWTREAGNNYTHARVLMMALASLTFDDNNTDDPLIATGAVLSAAVQSGGASWTTGETFTIAGGTSTASGTCSLAVGGVCKTVSISTAGLGYTNAANPVSTTATSGSGTGLTLNLFAGNTCGATRYQMCPDGTEGSLHAGWYYVDKALLYLDWATMEDPAVVQTAYNAAYGLASAPSCSTAWGGSVPCFGINQGGEPMEGLLYGGSMQKLRDALTYIRNAGYDDPIAWGPQVSLEDSSFWDLRYLSDAHAMVSLNSTSPSVSGEVGPGAWDYISDGDSLNPYIYPSYMATDASTLAYDASLPTPRTDRSNALEWISLNSAFGMADGTAGSCTAHGLYCGIMNEMGNDFGDGESWPLFIALPAGNPVTTSPPTDPRPSMPTTWYGVGNKRLDIRNGWAGTSTIFSFIATDTGADHEHQYGGRIEVNSNGYWLTKGRQVFNNYNDWVSISNYQNMIAIPNSTKSGFPSLSQRYGPGSLFGPNWHGYQGGTVPFLYSTLSTYAAMHVDTTGEYNGVWTNATDISSATRDVIYTGSVVAVYDRAAVGHAASTQTSYFNTTGAVTFTGSQGCWSDRGGTQKACYTPVYPSGATVTAVPWYDNLTVSAPSVNLQNGTTEQATATANYQNSTTQNAATYPDQVQGQTVTWTSATPSLCTISGTGLITAAASGTGQCEVYGEYTFTGGYTPAVMYINIVSGTSGGGSVSGTGGEPGPGSGDWQPEYYIKIVPSGTPTSTNFGAAFQWGASSFTPATTAPASSISGQTFDGILVGANAYWFMRSLTTFAGVTFPASSATTQYVANLTPNTSYAITGTGTPSSATSDNAGVLTFAATGTGNITVGAYIPPAITAVQGVSIFGATVQ